MIDTSHLEMKGWTKEEIVQAERILSPLEHPRGLMHAVLWTLVLVMVAGAEAFIFYVFPVLSLAGPALSAPLLFLIGACLGLLVIHVLHDLHLEKIHHHVAMVTLAALTTVLTLWLLAVLPDVQAPLLLAVSYAAGLVLPYILQWRLYGSS